MRIHVVGEDTISQQARSYAEYRVFALLTQLARCQPVRHAQVVLRPSGAMHGYTGVTCQVTVALDESSSLRIRAHGDHVYAAINNAIDRLKNAGTRQPAGAAALAIEHTLPQGG